jgi:hypothetical protein
MGDSDTVEAARRDHDQMPAPTDKTGVQRLLDMSTYFCEILSDLQPSDNTIA